MRVRQIMVLAVLAACSAATEPREITELRIGDNAVRLELSASSAELLAGTPDTLRVTLSNHGPSTVVLHFNDSCQILPYILDATGTVVLPSYGSWGCYLALTQIELAAGKSLVREFVWTGSTAFASEMPMRPLPSGTYYVVAEVPAREGKLRTRPVRITLRSDPR
jgi:hypothetical protein